MAHKTLAIVAVLSLAGLVFLAYLAMTFESPQQTRTMEIEQPVPRPAGPVREVSDDQDGADQDTDATDEEDAEPAGPLPLPEELVDAGQPPEEEVEPLPELSASDETVLERLANLELGARLLRLITPEEVIRRFVVFTDNVARGTLPQLDYPIQPPEEDLAVREVDDNLYVMEAATHDRFDAMINTLVSLEPEQALGVYESLRPLFVEAYAELGYGMQDFDEVVVDAIDRVLEADVPEGPYQLIRPSVMYEFADSRLEGLSPVQKQLIRLGPENTQRLRDRLRDYRAALTR